MDGLMRAARGDSSREVVEDLMGFADQGDLSR